MARPKSDNPKTEKVIVRVTPDELQTLAQASTKAGHANGRGPGVATFLRLAGLREAGVEVEK